MKTLSEVRWVWLITSLVITFVVASYAIAG